MTNTESRKAKIEKLHSIILANYTTAGDYDPAFAAKCAMEDILRMVFSQPHYIDQLLDDEIEDHLKAAANI